MYCLCKCVLPPGDNPIAVNKYIISRNNVEIHYRNDIRYCQALSGTVRYSHVRHSNYKIVSSYVANESQPDVAVPETSM